MRQKNVQIRQPFRRYCHRRLPCIPKKTPERSLSVSGCRVYLRLKDPSILEKITKLIWKYLLRGKHHEIPAEFPECDDQRLVSNRAGYIIKPLLKNERHYKLGMFP